MADEIVTETPPAKEVVNSPSADGSDPNAVDQALQIKETSTEPDPYEVRARANPSDPNSPILVYNAEGGLKNPEVWLEYQKSIGVEIPNQVENKEEIPSHEEGTPPNSDENYTDTKDIYDVYKKMFSEGEPPAETDEERYQRYREKQQSENSVETPPVKPDDDLFADDDSDYNAMIARKVEAEVKKRMDTQLNPHIDKMNKQQQYFDAMEQRRNVEYSDTEKTKVMTHFQNQGYDPDKMYETVHAYAENLVKKDPKFFEAINSRYGGMERVLFLKNMMDDEIGASGRQRIAEIQKNSRNEGIEIGQRRATSVMRHDLSDGGTSPPASPRKQIIDDFDLSDEDFRKKSELIRSGRWKRR